MSKQIQRIMKAMNVSEEDATSILQSAIDDPQSFQTRQDIINAARKPKQKLKGIQLRHVRGPVGRNDPCPCGSGKKLKKCCKNGRTIGIIPHLEEV